MKSLKLSLIAILMLGLISSCKKDDENDNQPVYKLAPNAYEIDQPTKETIVRVDSANVEFTGNTEQLQKLKVGDIILSGIAENAPYGFLRRITAIQKSGDDYTFATEDVSLLEAFEELHLDFSQTFTPDDTLIKKMQGVEFTVNFPAIPIYDADGDFFGSTDDQIKLDGSISYSPSLTLDVDISRARLDYAKIGGSFTTTNTIEVTAGASLASFDIEKTIYSQPLTPIQAGPIVIVPFLRVSIGADGSVYVAIVASDVMETTVATYIKYENEAWTTESSKQRTNSFSVTPIVGGVSARVYIEPGIDFKLYGSNLLNCSAIMQGYLNFEGALLPLGCEVRTGISAGVEAKSKVLGITIFDLSYPDIVDLSIPIYSCPSGPNCSGFSVSTSVSGNSVTANPSGGTAPYTYSWSNGATTKTISGLSNGNYTVTATDANNCTATATGTVGVNPCQTNPVSVSVDVSGSSLTANPSGGTAPFTYSWSNGQTSQTISGLNPGNYTVTVTDANLCTATATGTVGGVDPCIANPLTISVTVTDDEIDLSRSGASPYDYSWSGPNGFSSTSRNLSNLDPGTYYVTVTDANGCTATASGTVVGGGFPMIVYNSGTGNQNVRNMPSTTATGTMVITSVAAGKKFVAKSESNGWYLIDIPWDYVGSPTEGWARGGSGEMQPTSGNCIKVTDTEVIVFKTPGAKTHANVLWIDNGSSSTGNPEWLSTDIDQHYVYSLPTQQYGGYTWYRIDLPNFCNDNNGTQTTIGWISGEYSQVGNCQ